MSIKKQYGRETGEFQFLNIQTNYFLIFKILSNQLYRITLLCIQIEKINAYGFLIFKHINKQFSHFQITEKNNTSNYTVKHIHLSKKIQ